MCGDRRNPAFGMQGRVSCSHTGACRTDRRCAGPLPALVGGPYRSVVLMAVFVAAVGVAAAADRTAGDEGEAMTRPVELKRIGITVVYDNFGGTGGLRADWGFACMVEGLERTLLFDTGRDPLLLAENLRVLGKSLRDIDELVLSHEHFDHIGGLPAVRDACTDLTVWVPASFSAPVRRYIQEGGFRLEAVRTPRPICHGAATLGEMPSGAFWPDEQALVLDTDRGAIVITGCAHPGIVAIVEQARDVLDKKILLVMGGFHLGDRSEAQIRRIIARFEALGVHHAAPCHCSGELARHLFREAYGARYIDIGVGRVIRAVDFDTE